MGRAGGAQSRMAIEPQVRLMSDMGPHGAPAQSPLPGRRSPAGSATAAPEDGSVHDRQGLPPPHRASTIWRRDEVALGVQVIRGPLAYEIVDDPGDQSAPASRCRRLGSPNRIVITREACRPHLHVGDRPERGHGCEHEEDLRPDERHRCKNVDPEDNRLIHRPDCRSAKPLRPAGSRLRDGLP